MTIVERASQIYYVVSEQSSASKLPLGSQTFKRVEEEATVDAAIEAAVAELSREGTLTVREDQKRDNSFFCVLNEEFKATEHASHLTNHFTRRHFSVLGVSNLESRIRAAVETHFSNAGISKEFAKSKRDGNQLTLSLND